jgi:hypothetical protein
MERQEDKTSQEYFVKDLERESKGWEQWAWGSNLPNIKILVVMGMHKIHCSLSMTTLHRKARKWKAGNTLTIMESQKRVRIHGA